MSGTRPGDGFDRRQRNPQLSAAGENRRSPCEEGCGRRERCGDRYGLARHLGDEPGLAALRMIDRLDDVSDRARALGAVNAARRRADGAWVVDIVSKPSTPLLQAAGSLGCRHAGGAAMVAAQTVAILNDLGFDTTRA